MEKAFSKPKPKRSCAKQKNALFDKILGRDRKADRAGWPCTANCGLSRKTPDHRNASSTHYDRERDGLTSSLSVVASGAFGMKSVRMSTRAFPTATASWWGIFFRHAELADGSDEIANCGTFAFLLNRKGAGDCKFGQAEDTILRRYCDPLIGQRDFIFALIYGYWNAYDA